VTLIEKRMALEMGQFSGFLHSLNTKAMSSQRGLDTYL
ncbi:Os04g0439300, partial [Oryza sativa Japonica Group]